MRTPPWPTAGRNLHRRRHPRLAPVPAAPQARRQLVARGLPRRGQGDGVGARPDHLSFTTGDGTASAPEDISSASPEVLPDEYQLLTSNFADISVSCNSIHHMHCHDVGDMKDRLRIAVSAKALFWTFSSSLQPERSFGWWPGSCGPPEVIINEKNIDCIILRGFNEAGASVQKEVCLSGSSADAPSSEPSPDADSDLSTPPEPRVPSSGCQSSAIPTSLPLVFLVFCLVVVRRKETGSTGSCLQQAPRQLPTLRG